MPIALTTFFAPGRQVTKGEELKANDPVIKGREHLFDDVKVTTTKRSTKRSAKSGE